MRLVVSIGALMPILRWTRRLLTSAAVVMLGYCGFVLLDSMMFQEREHRHVQQRLLTNREAAAPAVRPHTSPPVDGALIGRLEIDSLGLSAVIVEGTDESSLRRALGHIPGTALPGSPGNVSIAGHRDTFFRPLRNIRQNDLITLTTLLGEYRYRVVSRSIVTPSDVAVLDPGEEEILTLVTCYPFRFVGPAPERFIVRAERVTASNTQGTARYR